MRNSKTQSFRVIFLLVLFMFALAPRAFAYIDLGTGSFFFQVLLAAILGFLFTLKGYRKKIKIFLIDLFSKNKNK